MLTVGYPRIWVTFSDTLRTANSFMVSTTWTVSWKLKIDTKYYIYIPINHIGHNFKYSLSLIILVFLDSVIFFQLFKFIFQPLFLGLVSRVGILYQRGNCLVLQQGHHHLLIDFYLFLLKIKVHVCRCERVGFVPI